MEIVINGQTEQVVEQTLAELLARLEIAPPFAVAINTAFVSKEAYAQQALNEGDQVEIVRPVVGG